MKIKKIVTIFLATLFAFSMVACDNGNGDSGNKKPNPPTATGTIGDLAQHYYTGGLHKFNVTQTNVAFVENNQTEYKIVLSENPMRLRWISLPEAEQRDTLPSNSITKTVAIANLF